MFTLHGNRYPFYGRLTRRHFFRATGWGMGGLGLAQLLQAEAAAGLKNGHKAVINIHLDGGPPHQDLIDLKPDAPAEIRGEFKPIATSIPGFQVCELMPRLARLADRMAFIRSLVGFADAHDAFQLQSGFKEIDLKPIGGRPALGSVVSHLKGNAIPEIPAFVDLMQGRPFVRNSARPGFLGRTAQPFRPDVSHLFKRRLEPGMVRELAARGPEHATQLTLPAGLTAQRVLSRVQLRTEIDRFQKSLDDQSAAASMDPFTLQAVQMLTSGRFAQAMDLSQEEPRVLERYTLPNESQFVRFETADGPESIKKFLLARRLVEAGVRCVSISLSDFDTHSQNFSRMRNTLPLLDIGLANLVEDLEERGLLDDVSIVVWGEFGRTPKIAASNGGRDHWPRVGMAMMAGGGIRAGQVIGSTDRDGGSAIARPVHVQELFATLYHNLGIDPATTMIQDPTGRPQSLINNAGPIRELI